MLVYIYRCPELVLLSYGMINNNGLKYLELCKNSLSLEMSHTYIAVLYFSKHTTDDSNLGFAAQHN